MKNINKKYLIFIGLGIILLITAIIFKTSINEKEDNLSKQNINTNLTLDNGKAIANSQLDAYKEEEIDSMNKNRSNSNMDLSNFGKVNNNNENINTKIVKKGKTDDEIIDSILNAQKISYKAAPVKRNNNSTGYSRNRNSYKISKERRKREKEALILERKREQEELAKKEKERLSKFFTEQNNSNQSTTNINNNNVLHTDKNIEIMVNGDQNIKSGTRVNLILTKKAIINGISYLRNTKLYGFASFGEHRLFINVNNIKNNKVKLKIYDAQDGNLGLYTKVNLAGEIGNDIADDNINDGNDVVIAGVKVGSTVKKIFKKKNKEKKILIFNRTKFIMN